MGKVLQIDQQKVTPAPMFAHLARFGRILVTGPQRSGTTICAKMIANDTGHRHVDEAEFGAHNWDRFEAIYNCLDPVVIQCPALSYRITDVARDPGTAVVWMLRPLAEIIASQERIGWTAAEEPRELAKYGRHKGPIAIVKQQVWRGYQRPLVAHPFEVEYHDLAGHPMWVPADQRRGFAPKQTEV